MTLIVRLKIKLVKITGGGNYEKACMEQTRSADNSDILDARGKQDHAQNSPQMCTKYIMARHILLRGMCK